MACGTEKEQVHSPITVLRDVQYVYILPASPSFRKEPALTIFHTGLPFICLFLLLKLAPCMICVFPQVLEMGPNTLDFVLITDSHINGAAGLGAGHSWPAPSHSKEMEAYQLGSSKDAQLRFEPMSRGSEPVALSSVLCSSRTMLRVS